MTCKAMHEALRLRLRRCAFDFPALRTLLQLRKNMGAPLVSPLAFAAWLRRDGLVSDGAAAAILRLVSMYADVFIADVGQVDTLDYSSLGWDNAAGLEMCGALRYAHTHGGLRNLKALSLFNNNLGDEFIVALVALIDEGGFSSAIQH